MAMGEESLEDQQDFIRFERHKNPSRVIRMKKWRRRHNLQDHNPVSPLGEIIKRVLGLQVSA